MKQHYKYAHALVQGDRVRIGRGTVYTVLRSYPVKDGQYMIEWTNNNSCTLPGGTVMPTTGRQVKVYNK